MISRFLVLGVGVAAWTVSTLADDKPGSETGWTEDKVTKEAHKTIPIRVVRAGGGPDKGGYSRGYFLDLPHDKVRAEESDSNVMTRVLLNEKFDLELRKDSKGTPFGVTVRIGEWMYHDLNCDGEWDARVDRRPNAPHRFIWLNEHWVRVKYHKLAFDLGSESNFFDEKTEYVWDGKVWTVKPPRR